MAKNTSKQNTTKTTKVKEAAEFVVEKDELIQKLLKEVEDLKAQLAQKQEEQPAKLQDWHRLVPCRSVVKGQVIYKSPRTLGYKVVWNDFGDVEYVELGELKTMYSSYPRFFTEPWIIVDDVEVIKLLKLEKYYKNIIDLDDIDAIFDLPNDKFIDVITKVPRGIKQLIIQRAVELLKEGKLDSIAKKEAIERIFNVDLDLVM